MIVFGEHDEKTLAQMAEVEKRAVRVALMADGHFGYVMPIGGVAAYREQVSIAGVGVDIACGNAAIRTNLTAYDLSGRLAELADEIADVIPLGVGLSNENDDAPKDHPLFDSPAWDAYSPSFRGNLRERARQQLGSTGGGNHYVDVFADEQGRIWVGVHFGSRGLGSITAHGFHALAQDGEWKNLKPRPPRGMDTEELLALDMPLGEAYWAAMTLCGEYAYAGREWVARKVVSILGGVEEELVHNHHNFAWREKHFGEYLVVVRKGATPAFLGQRGFVGGSMGDMSVILIGSPNEHANKGALRSTVHGAGRVMGRVEAKGKRSWKTGELILNEDGSPKRLGRVSQEMMDEATIGVEVRGGDLDEAPQAYRKLRDVLDVQPGIEVLHELQPLIVCMAPRRTR